VKPAWFTLAERIM